MLDFRTPLECLLVNSRQGGRQNDGVQLVVRSKRAGADIFATFGQHNFLHPYLLAQLGGHKLHIRTEDKIAVPITVQIIEYRRRSRRILGIPYNVRAIVDTPRYLFVRAESCRKEQRVLKRNGRHTILVVSRRIGFTVKNTAVDLFQTIRPTDNFQFIAVAECHIPDILDAFTQIALHHRRTVREGVSPYRIHRIGQLDLLQLIAVLEHVRGDLRHAVRYLARRKVPPVPECRAAESG